jgi:hypothetical protein
MKKEKIAKSIKMMEIMNQEEEIEIEYENYQNKAS